eukprot:m.666600 g.666600  ORF g.666600 m.666600 type:complete len:225 (-) comp22750_c0_seq4:205-879(-)
MDPANVLKMKEAGNSMLRRGNYKVASQLYEQCISNDPSNAVYYSNASQAYLSSGFYEKAYESAVKGLSCEDSLTNQLRTKLVVRTSKALFYQGKFGDCSSILEAKLSPSELQENPSVSRLLLAAKRQHSQQRRSTAASSDISDLFVDGILNGSFSPGRPAINPSDPTGYHPLGHDDAESVFSFALNDCIVCHRSAPHLCSDCGDLLLQNDKMKSKLRYFLTTAG